MCTVAKSNQQPVNNEMMAGDLLMYDGKFDCKKGSTYPTDVKRNKYVLDKDDNRVLLGDKDFNTFVTNMKDTKGLYGIGLDGEIYQFDIKNNYNPVLVTIENPRDFIIHDMDMENPCVHNFVVKHGPNYVRFVADTSKLGEEPVQQPASQQAPQQPITMNQQMVCNTVPAHKTMGSGFMGRGESLTVEQKPAHHTMKPQQPQMQVPPQQPVNQQVPPQQMMDSNPYMNQMPPQQMNPYMGQPMYGQPIMPQMQPQQMNPYMGNPYMGQPMMNPYMGNPCMGNYMYGQPQPQERVMCYGADGPIMEQIQPQMPPQMMNPYMGQPMYGQPMMPQMPPQQPVYVNGCEPVGAGIMGRGAQVGQANYQNPITGNFIQQTPPPQQESYGPKLNLSENGDIFPVTEEQRAKHNEELLKAHEECNDPNCKCKTDKHKKVRPVTMSKEEEQEKAAQMQQQQQPMNQQPQQMMGQPQMQQQPVNQQPNNGNGGYYTMEQHLAQQQRIRPLCDNPFFQVPMSPYDKDWKPEMFMANYTPPQPQQPQSMMYNQPQMMNPYMAQGNMNYGMPYQPNMVNGNYPPSANVSTIDVLEEKLGMSPNPFNTGVFVQEALKEQNAQQINQLSAGEYGVLQKMAARAYNPRRERYRSTYLNNGTYGGYNYYCGGSLRDLYYPKQQPQYIPPMNPVDAFKLKAQMAGTYLNGKPYTDEELQNIMRPKQPQNVNDMQSYYENLTDEQKAARQEFIYTSFLHHLFELPQEQIYITEDMWIANNIAAISRNFHKEFDDHSLCQFLEEDLPKLKYEQWLRENIVMNENPYIKRNFLEEIENANGGEKYAWDFIRNLHRRQEDIRRDPEKYMKELQMEQIQKEMQYQPQQVEISDGVVKTVGEDGRPRYDVSVPDFIRFGADEDDEDLKDYMEDLKAFELDCKAKVDEANEKRRRKALEESLKQGN